MCVIKEDVLLNVLTYRKRHREYVALLHCRMCEKEDVLLNVLTYKEEVRKLMCNNKIVGH